MANATTLNQNQNIQMAKFFIAALAGVIIAVPIVVILTTAIVKAQLGAVTESVLASYAPNNNAQTNQLIGGHCEAPAEVEGTSSAASTTNTQTNLSDASTNWGWGYGDATGSYNQTNTSTVDNSVTKNISHSYKKTVKKIDISVKDSFNIGSNNNNDNVIDSFNDNFSNNGSNNTVDSYNDNNVNSNNQLLSNNAVNSNNTVNNDNDLIDIL
jgi:hypothetical protein